MSAPGASYNFKVSFVGESGVGKTCLITRLCSDVFQRQTTNTLGVDLAVKELSVGENRVKLSLWDTAGQERFRAITRQYYRAMHAVVFVFDVTKRGSYDALESLWIPEVQQHNTTPELVQIIVGNKIDVEDYERQVPPELGAELARRHNCLYYETSACTAEGVHESFLLGLVSTLLGSPQLQQHAQQRAGHNAAAVALSNKQAGVQQASGGCCSY